MGVQLATMLDLMYRFQAANADSLGEPPPEVPRDLVAKTLGHCFRASKFDVQRATDLILAEPEAFDDEWDDDEEQAGELDWDEPLEQNGMRLH